MKLYTIAFLMLVAGSAAGQIESLTGPASTCPTLTNTYAVTYYTMPPSPYYSEYGCEVRWTFSLNGQVFSTLYSSPQSGIPTTVRVNASNFPLGTVRVEVRVKLCYFSGPNFGFRYATKTMDTFVGLAAPATLSGPSFLCPGSSGVYTAAAVNNATSYKWEVPSYWTVNGISGPVVTTTSRNVTISVPSCDNTAFRRIYPGPTYGTVKVSAVSATCGTSSSNSLGVFIDYQTTLQAVENADGTTTFQVNYDYFPAYGWSSPLPEGWQLISTSRQGYQLTVNTNQIPGQVGLEFRTPCGCVYGLSMFWYPPEPPPPPPPCCQEVIQAYPIPARNTLHLRVPKGAVANLFVDGKPVSGQLEDGEVRLDISSLTPGPHILHVNAGAKQSKTLRFVKAEQ